MITKLLVILLSALVPCLAAPTTYDQRQDGDLNVKVDLENFLILVAKPASTLDMFASMSDLFAIDLSKRTSSPSSTTSAVIPAASDDDESTKDLPETKSADTKDLEDVSLDSAKPEKAPAGINNSEGMIVLVQEGDKAARSLEDIVRNLRNLKAKDQAPVENKEAAKAKAIGGVAGKYKFVESVEEPQNLKLIGDAIENCGPGRSRDRLGICQGDGLAQE